MPMDTNGSGTRSDAISVVELWKQRKAIPGNPNRQDSDSAVTVSATIPP
jgi:hypothetical protein